jgi:hypothetical protein
VAIVTLTVDRPTRDILRGLVLWDAMDLEIDIAIANGERDTTYDLQDKLAFLLPLLDAVGWQDEDDRSAYEIAVDRDLLLRWLVRHREGVEQDLGSNVITLARQERGDEGYGYSGCTLAESVEMTRGYIASNQTKAEAIIALISGLCEPAAAVA